jgi:hypothetical protein
MRTILLFLMAVSAGAHAEAQMPGMPVLQNAWATPGIMLAVNVGGGGGGVWGAAASWAPDPARFQLSGGGGMQSRSGGGSRGVYGVRAAMPMLSFMNGRAGAAVFAGVGGGAGASGDTAAITSNIPVGAAFGYRHSMGGSRGFSVYAAPSYRWVTKKSGSDGLVRVAAGIDVGLASKFGVTAGIEFGQSGGGGGTSYAVGAAYRLR